MYSFYEGLDSLATSLETAFWIILVVTVIIRVIAANKFNEIAQQKGHDGYFGWCFFLGLAGWLMVAALPDRGQTPAVYTAQSSTQTRAQLANIRATAPKPADENSPEL